MDNNEEVLRFLKDTKGYVSGEKIAGELNISRAAVWKRIGRLKREGFLIDAEPRLGYRLVIPPDKLLPIEIKDGLRTNYIGQEIIYYPKTESTNMIARNLAMEGAGEGTIVIAEEQTKGRGRLDRSWISPAGKNILMSLIFRPEVMPRQVFFLTMLSSLSVIKAIRKITSLEAHVKWPNDIFMEYKKIGGILTEFSAEQDRVNYVIIGIGLNVNFDPSLFPEIRDIATSISRVFKMEVSRIDLLRAILEEMEIGYGALKQGRIDEIREEWDKCSMIKGREVTITSFDSIIEGIVESMDEDGCLILRDRSGKRKKIVSGDVSLRLKE